MKEEAMKYVAPAALGLILAAACGSDEAGDAGGSAPERASGASLAVVDTIGVGMGDSLYMFGTVDALAHGPDGEVLVLDGMRNSIGRYSPEGEFLNWIGREGEGPGELLHPSDMALVPERGLAVNDLAQSRITFFDQQGDVGEEIKGFTPFPPTRLCGSTIGLVGSRREFDRQGNRYGFAVGLWTGSPEMDRLYHSRMMEFNRDDIQRTVSATSITFAASQFDGRVYVAPLSTEEYSVLIYSPEGTLEAEISQSRPSVRRPEADIEREREDMNRQLREEGAPEDMLWEPREHRYQIAGLWVGPENRLWILDGTCEDPLFHVCSPQCEALFDCRVEGLSGSHWDFAIDAGGFMATQSDPLDFPRVYILSLQEE